MNPWVMLLLFLIGNVLLVTGILMIWKGTYPPPLTRVRAHPVVGTAVLLVGLTMILHFGDPTLLQQLLDRMGISL